MRRRTPWQTLMDFHLGALTPRETRILEDFRSRSERVRYASRVAYTPAPIPIDDPLPPPPAPLRKPDPERVKLCDGCAGLLDDATLDTPERIAERACSACREKIASASVKYALDLAALRIDDANERLRRMGTR